MQVLRNTIWRSMTRWQMHWRGVGVSAWCGEGLVLKLIWRRFGRRIWNVGCHHLGLRKLALMGLAEKYRQHDTNKLMHTFVNFPDQYVNYTPTMTGGTGPEELSRFYGNFFLTCMPENLHLRLISRAIGVDQIVDELYVQFKHTTEIPWMLPQVPPTGMKVEIVLVAIVTFRAGKIWRERVYW